MTRYPRHISAFRRGTLLRAALLLSLAASLALGPASASLARSKNRKKNIPYRSVLLIEAETGRLLRAVNPRRKVIPASLVKMMVTLIAMERMEENTLRPTDIVTVSRDASKIGGQQVYLSEGERFTINELLKAVSISSANDAAYAVAEYIAGDIDVFIELMNDRAKQLGMTDTSYVNVHGLPPNRGEPPNLTSARDLAILARRLLKYSLATKMMRTRSATFRNGTFILTNTNKLIGRYPGADGIKTGSYRAAGYSIVATARRDNLRLIAIILASDNPKRRFKEARHLLSWGFSRYRWIDPAKAVSISHPKLKVLQGTKKEILLKESGNIRTLVKRGQEKRIASMIKIPDSIRAPVKNGQTVGKIIYQVGGKNIGEVALLAAESVERSSFLCNFIKLK